MENLEVGKWYKTDIGHLVFLTEISKDKKGCSAWGFFDGIFNDSLWQDCSADTSNLIEVSTKEVITAIFIEAQRRELIPTDENLDMFFETFPHIKDIDNLIYRGKTIFENGKFAKKEKKVYEWRWVYRSYEGDLLVSEGFYTKKNIVEFTRPIQKIKSTKRLCR